MSLQPDHDTITQPHEQAVLDDLGKLADALTERGYLAQVLTPAGELAHVHARNPEVAALSERIFARADSFCWPWDEPIAPRDQISAAATAVAHVLAAPLTTTGEHSPEPAPRPAPPAPGHPQLPAAQSTPPPAATQTRTTPNFTLRAWRESNGMTRSRMAEALNQTPSARRDGLDCDAELIAEWESGHIRWPTSGHQRALRALTGRHPGALGFSAAPAAPRTRSTKPGRDEIESSLDTAEPDLDTAEPGADKTGDLADPASIGDLADLAAELSGRGYSTALDTQPPRLAIGAPDDSNHGHIITVGPCFCLDEIPFSLRPPMPLTMTADAIDMLTHLTTAGRR